MCDALRSECAGEVAVQGYVTVQDVGTDLSTTWAVTSAGIVWLIF